MAHSLQHRQATQFIGLSSTFTGKHRSDGPKADNALTDKPDHQMGARHSSVQAAYDDYEIWFSKIGRLGKLGRGQFSKRMEAHLRIPKKRTEAGYCFIGVALR